MERHTNWALVIGASLASSGLTAGLLLGLGVGRGTPRAPARAAVEVSTSRMETLLEQVVERLDRRPLEVASTTPIKVPATEQSATLSAPEHTPLERPPVDAGLLAAIVALRKSVDELGHSNELRTAGVFDDARELDTVALQLLKVRYPGDEGPEQFMNEYRLQSVNTLLERFGRPTDLESEGQGSSQWSWRLENVADVSVSVYLGLITDVSFWAEQ